MRQFLLRRLPRLGLFPAGGHSPTTARGHVVQPTCRVQGVWSRSSRYFSTSSLNFESEGVPHFKRSSTKHPLSDQIPSADGGDGYTLPHPIWSKEEVEGVQVIHTPPKDGVDKAAYYGVQTMRLFFDLFSGYKWGVLFGTLDEKKWLTRIIFLETVAGVPGMVGAMVRHLKSLRLMKRDRGWIHTLLEEAENERMHLLTALELRCPGPVFKGTVVVSQGVFVSLFWICYAISPRFCHRFVGYLEEEAVKTYTQCLACIDSNQLPMWSKMPAPQIAVVYWKLQEKAMMRDVILAIRADEAHHRVVNHTLSSLDHTSTNPHSPGK